MSVDPARCILVFFSPSQRRFVRLDQIPAGLLRGAGELVGTYRPRELLVERRGKQPRAVAEFLSEAAFASGGARRSRRAGSSPDASRLLSLDPAVESRVQVDVFGAPRLEKRGAEDAVELGSGRARGYGALLWAHQRATASLTVQCELAPAPQVVQTGVFVRLTDANGAERTARRDRGAGRTAIIIELPSGVSVLEVWLQGRIDARGIAEARGQSVLGCLHGMRLE